MKRLATPTAFTLIEVLVVVSIIVLLIALLMPALGKAKDHAEVAVCAANLRQIGNGAFEYTTENSREFCGAFFWIRHNYPNLWHDWHTQPPVRDGYLYPYVQSDSVYLCPTYLKVYKHGATPNFSCGDSSNVTPYYSYSMNASLGWSGWAGLKIQTTSAVRQPDQMMYISEENTWVIPGFSSVPINNGALGKGPDAIASYHLPGSGGLNTGKGNVLFVDLHVDLHTYTETDILTSQ